MKKSTGELLELLKSTPAISDYLTAVSDELVQKPALSDYLEKILSEKELKKSEVIKRSSLDRGYAYDIFSGSKLPSQDKVLALCFALDLSASETQRLLITTGYPHLYARRERDSIILFALEHKLSLNDVNELLYEMHYAILE